MKQVTVRLGDMAAQSLEELKRIYGYKSSQDAVVSAVLGFDTAIRKQNELQKQLAEANAVIKYLEEQLKSR